MVVMIGVDPHKGSHTAVALDDDERLLDELRVRSASNQLDRLLGWAAAFVERTWAIEGAGGLGYLLAQQLVAAGERVLDVQPKLAARVRLLATGSIRTRTTPTTLARWPSPRSRGGGGGGSRRGSCGGDEGVGETPPGPVPAAQPGRLPAPCDAV